jgi:hypothetical protein
MALGGTYSTGTISVAANAVAVVGAGTLWGSVAEQGDWLMANGAVGLIDTVTDDAHIVLAMPWKGGALAAAPYAIVKMSWLRYDPALTQAKVREFIADITAAGIYLFVTGAAPDPSLGEEGQWALKTNDGSGKLWFRTGGQWVLQGSFAGIQWLRTWSNLVTYRINNVVARLGKAWISNTTNTNRPPESSPGDWDVFTSNGDRYDVAVDASDRPESGERLAKVVFTTTVTFPAHLPDCRAVADVAATASTVFALKKNGVQFATATFAAAATAATFASAADAVFAAGDVLTLDAPDPRDATLADLAFMLTGSRA